MTINATMLEDDDTVLEYWNDRDIESIPFSNFWYYAVLYQILEGISDNGLADILATTPKTVAAWRESIEIPAVILPLLKIIGRLPEVMRNPYVVRIQEKLCQRLSQIDRSSVKTRRAAAALPTITNFTLAVRASKFSVLALAAEDARTVIKRYKLRARNTEKRMNNNPGMRTFEAKVLAKSVEGDWPNEGLKLRAEIAGEALIQAYRESLQRSPLHRSRATLEVTMCRLASISAQMSLMHADSVFPERQGFHIDAADALIALREHRGTSGRSKDEAISEDEANNLGLDSALRPVLISLDADQIRRYLSLHRELSVEKKNARREAENYCLALTSEIENGEDWSESVQLHKDRHSQKELVTNAMLSDRYAMDLARRYWLIEKLSQVHF